MPCPMCQKKHPYAVGQALTSLAGTSRRLQRLTERISSKQASARPAPDKWSAKEIICHLADCELVYGMRYRKIVAEPKPSLVPFDQDAWADNLQYRRQPLKGSLATFLALRGSNLAMLKALPKSAWNKKGQHPSYGELSLKQLVVHIADHDRNHVAQVEKLAR
jgi:hypothetical protein